MAKSSDAELLTAMHTPEAIERRIASGKSHSYLGDFVLGAVDGAVTTFAIVAGAAGAGLSSGVAIVLGLANVAADGFSMAASNFLKARADRQVVDRFRSMEEMHIDRVPEAEREEIRQIFSAKGFDGSVLDSIVQVITDDRNRWVDTMLTEEWGLRLESPSPFRSGLTTFVAFVSTGLVPLLPLFLAAWLFSWQLFTASAVLTALTFFCIGLAQGRLAGRNALWSGVETLLIGGTAASLAFVVGAWLKGMASG